LSLRHTMAQAISNFVSFFSLQKRVRQKHTKKGLQIEALKMV